MQLNSRSNIAGLILFLGGSLALAQGGPGPGGPPDGQPPPPLRGAGRAGMAGKGRGPGRLPGEGGLGRVLRDPQMVQKLGITDDQVKKMEDIFQQHRLKLIDLNADLQKAEATLEPLMSADHPDEAKVVAQIDRVAQSRAELEKANARMLLAVRQVLTPEQWKKLQQERPRPEGGQGVRPRRPPQE
jgi:protein CpxP